MEKILETEKEKLRTFFQNKIEQQGIKMRMYVPPLTLPSDRSAALNKQRIVKMTQRNKYVEESIKECKIQITKYFEIICTC